MDTLKRPFLLSFSFFLLPVLLTAAQASASALRYAEGEALVVLKNGTGQKLSASTFSATGAARSLAVNAASTVRASFVKTYTALSEASNLIVVHMKSDSQKTETLIAELQKTPPSFPQRPTM
jgi:hypothetical protein